MELAVLSWRGQPLAQPLPWFWCCFGTSWHTVVSFPWQQLVQQGEGCSAGLEVWEWAEEGGEDLFDVSWRGGVGSCSKQSRLSVNRLSAVRGRLLGHCLCVF